MKNMQIISALILTILALAGCSIDKDKLRVIEKGSVLEIANGLIKAKFAIEDSCISQQFYAHRNDNWILVAESFIPITPSPDSATKLFDTSLDPAHRFLISESLKQFSVESKSRDKVVVKFTGISAGIPLKQWVTLEKDKDFFHFEIEAELAGKPARLDYLLSAFTFNINHPPFFVHTPGLKFDNEDSRQNRF
jgi:hypothetical protein